MIQEDATIFRTPRRQRKSCRPHGNAQRRRSLFADSKESDDDIASLSPTSSEIGTPIKESPVGSVKNLESNFNQLLLNRTPNKDFPFTPPRLSPRIKGVRCLSEDADLIKKNTFYGGRPLGAAATAGPVDGKSLFASIRSTIHQR
ncbi:Hypothetical protein NTJ_07757 [Nesidiocoris tenuis]|uniref:Uncharacterized protein n=1 Tax=Nesidiocoris tenuis TaxID=355587 RepID=A0ABN7ARW4_9HEMI|nr:Hypothetical protein NTJ_07757 [Nesidiocoris tenuis]